MLKKLNVSKNRDMLIFICEERNRKKLLVNKKKSRGFGKNH